MPPRHEPPLFRGDEDLDYIRVMWGARIRRRREKLGLTQTDLARYIGVTQGEISRIESGERNVADLDRIALARVFSCSVRTLFSYEERREDDEGAA